MHPVEFTWYKLIVLITSAIAIAFGIVNIVYFNKIRLNNNCNDVTNSQAVMALWFNIILVIFAGITFFWSLFRLIFTGQIKPVLVNKTYNTHNYPASPAVVATVPTRAGGYVMSAPTVSPTSPLPSIVTGSPTLVASPGIMV